MDRNLIRNYAIRSGKSEKEVSKQLERAKNEADIMGKRNDIAYVTLILKSLIGLDESSSKGTTKKVTSRFIQSNYTSMSKFLEDCADGKLDEIQGSVSNMGLTPTENPVGIINLGDKSKQKKNPEEHKDDYELVDVDSIQKIKDKKIADMFKKRSSKTPKKTVKSDTRVVSRKSESVLQEDFSEKDMERAVKLIKGLIEKRTGFKLIKMGKSERFRKKRLGELYGLKFKVSGSNWAIRFNWSNRWGKEIHSLDFFKNIKRSMPTFTLPVAGDSVVRIIPIIADTLNDGKPKQLVIAEPETPIKKDAVVPIKEPSLGQENQAFLFDNPEYQWEDVPYSMEDYLEILEMVFTELYDEIQNKVSTAQSEYDRLEEVYNKLDRLEVMDDDLGIPAIDFILEQGRANEELYETDEENYYKVRGRLGKELSKVLDIEEPKLSDKLDNMQHAQISIPMDKTFKYNSTFTLYDVFRKLTIDNLLILDDEDGEIEYQISQNSLVIEMVAELVEVIFEPEVVKVMEGVLNLVQDGKKVKALEIITDIESY